jgi:GNAT superfamily N-acetyltransferase
MIATTMRLMDTESAAHIERCETEYFALRLEMLRALPGNPYGIEVRRYGDMVASQVRHSENYWFFNRVMGMNHEDLGRLDEVIGWYRENKVNCRFDIVPSLASASLLRRLNDYGLFQSDFTAALYGRPGSDLYMPHNVTIRPVQAHEGHLMARVFLDSYWVPEERQRFIADSLSGLPGHPAIRCYFAYVDSSLAGMAVLFLSGDTGYLASAATLPEFRGYGCQQALIYARMAAAAAEGCSLIAAHSDVLSRGQRNLEKLGLRVAYTKVVWTERE